MCCKRIWHNFMRLRMLIWNVSTPLYVLPILRIRADFTKTNSLVFSKSIIYQTTFPENQWGPQDDLRQDNEAKYLVTIIKLMAKHIWRQITKTYDGGSETLPFTRNGNLVLIGKTCHGNFRIQVDPVGRTSNYAIRHRIESLMAWLGPNSINHGKPTWNSFIFQSVVNSCHSTMYIS